MAAFILMTVFLPSCTTVNEDGSIRLREGTVYPESSDTFNYYVFIPNTIGARPEKYATLFLFHARGESAKEYMTYWIKEAAKHNMMIVAPDWEKPKVAGKVEIDKITELINEVVMNYPIDTSQQYLAGLSAGGLVSRWMLEDEPARWQGVMFIAFGPESGWVKRLGNKTYPDMYFAVGAQDKQVDLDMLWKAVKQLKANGTRVDYLVDPRAGHEHRPTWTRRMLKWMLQGNKEGTFASLRQ